MNWLLFSIYMVIHNNYKFWHTCQLFKITGCILTDLRHKQSISTTDLRSWQVAYCIHNKTITKYLLYQQWHNNAVSQLADTNLARTWVQISANFHKSWNSSMSNDGLIIENMDLPHIHLAVQWGNLIFKLPFFLPQEKTRTIRKH